jgi:hypothetical protein
MIGGEAVHGIAPDSLAEFEGISEVRPLESAG